MLRSLTLAAALLAAGCVTGASAPAAGAGNQDAARVVAEVFEAFNRHDAAAMASHYAPDALLTSSDHCGELHGRDALQRMHSGLFASAPDIHDELIEIIANGNRVAVRFVSRSHIPGRQFEMSIGDFFRVENGLIVEDHTIFDNGGRPCEQ